MGKVKINLTVLLCDRSGGVAERAIALQMVNWGSIRFSSLFTKKFENGIHREPAWRSTMGVI